MTAEVLSEEVSRRNDTARVTLSDATTTQEVMRISEEVRERFLREHSGQL